MGPGFQGRVSLSAPCPLQFPCEGPPYPTVPHSRDGPFDILSSPQLSAKPSPFQVSWARPSTTLTPRWPPHTPRTFPPTPPHPSRPHGPSLQTLLQHLQLRCLLLLCPICLHQLPALGNPPPGGCNLVGNKSPRCCALVPTQMCSRIQSHSHPLPYLSGVIPHLCQSPSPFLPGLRLLRSR